jgi:hypothetical protein
MTDQLLGFLKICLLVLLYLFFARVLWAVWSEVRSPRRQPQQPQPQQQAGPPPPQRAAQRVGVPGSVDPTVPTSGVPVAASAAAGAVAAPGGPKPARGRRGHVGRMIVIEPRARKGAAFSVGGEITIGRAAGCTVSVPDDTFVSQLHARLWNENGDVKVEDLGSTNGSYLNGHRLVQPATIHKGDRLQIGNTVWEAG